MTLTMQNLGHWCRSAAALAIVTFAWATAAQAQHSPSPSISPPPPVVAPKPIQVPPTTVAPAPGSGEGVAAQGEPMQEMFSDAELSAVFKAVVTDAIGGMSYEEIATLSAPAVTTMLNDAGITGYPPGLVSDFVRIANGAYKSNGDARAAVGEAVEVVYTAALDFFGVPPATGSAKDDCNIIMAFVDTVVAPSLPLAVAVVPPPAATTTSPAAGVTGRVQPLPAPAAAVPPAPGPAATTTPPPPPATVAAVPPAPTISPWRPVLATAPPAPPAPAPAAPAAAVPPAPGPAATTTPPPPPATVAAVPPAPTVSPAPPAPAPAPVKPAGCNATCQQKVAVLQEEADEIRQQAEDDYLKDIGKTVVSTIFTSIGIGFGLPLATLGAPIAGVVVPLIAGVIGIATMVTINDGEVDKTIAIDITKTALNAVVPGGGTFATETTKVVLIEGGGYAANKY